MTNNNIMIKYETREYKKELHEKEIMNWIDSLYQELDIPKQSLLSLYFTNNEIIQELNCNYRKKDKPTDVLSFSQLEGDGLKNLPGQLLGDIIISVPYAKKSAIKKKHSVHKEINILLLHGLIHLLGYDHEKDSNNEMLNLQNKIYHNLTGEEIE